VAKFFLARPDQLAARARPHTRFSRQYCATCARGRASRPGEDQSVIRLAREFIDTIVAGLNEAPDAEVRLNQIVRDLNRLRHVSITRQGEAVEISGTAANPDDNADARSPPAWFVALFTPKRPP